MEKNYPTHGTTVDNRTIVTIDKEVAKWQEMVNRGEMTEYEQATLIMRHLAKQGIYL